MSPTKDTQNTVTAITRFLQEKLPVDRVLGACRPLLYGSGVQGAR